MVKHSVRTSIGSLTKTLTVLLAVTFLYRATTNMYQTSIPLDARYILGVSEITVSYITTIAMIVSFASIVLTSLVIKVIKRIVLLGFSLMLVGTLLLLWASDVYSLTAVATLINFGSGPIQPLLLTTSVLISTEANRFKTISLYTSALSLSLIAGPLYQAAMLQASKGDLLVSILAFAPLIALALTLFTRVPVNEKVNSDSRLDLSFLKDKGYLMGLAANGTYSFPFVALVTFGGIYAKTLFNATYTRVELLFAVFFIVSFLTRITMGRLGGSRITLMETSIAATISGLALLYYSPSYQLLLAAFALLGYPHGATYPVSASYIADSVPNHRLAVANFVSSFIFGVTTIVAVPLIGAAEQLLGLREGFLLLEAPVIAIAALFFSAYRAQRHSPIATT
ncbi:MAG: MFS transporter [Thermoprotei archaeon]